MEAIHGNAAQLQSHVAATREALNNGGDDNLTAMISAGYVAAQRCHVCRGWVQVRGWRMVVSCKSR